MQSNHNKYIKFQFERKIFVNKFFKFKDFNVKVTFLLQYKKQLCSILLCNSLNFFEKNSIVCVIQVSNCSGSYMFPS